MKGPCKPLWFRVPTAVVKFGSPITTDASMPSLNGGRYSRTREFKSSATQRLSAESNSTLREQFKPFWVSAGVLLFKLG